MMKQFLCEDFLLSNKVSQELFHDVAKDLPIYDYHCHLSPKDIAQDRRFENLTQIWLEGDHYKWRAMRACAVEEEFITGQASDYEKYQAWARVVPQCLGNPIYHWTHMELKRPFGIANTLFNPQSCGAIWQETQNKLQSPAFSARSILQKMKVKFVGTTDDPCDSLQYHRQIAEDSSFDVEVSPSFRPDRAFKVDHEGFLDYLEKLSAVTNTTILNYADFIAALLQRVDYFQKHSCRSADHGIEEMFFESVPTEHTLDHILKKRIRSEILSETEVAQFFTAVHLELAAAYRRRGWVMQLHIGAQRNNNSRMFSCLGRDAGYDSIGDMPFAHELASLLNAMDEEDNLPQTILYSLNPCANEVLATMAGNFQNSECAGKIQFGAAWWFNDQKDGMQRQLEQLSQLGVLSTFVGMLTDSRSFLSFTRHEYFRRILCEKVGAWVVNGEAPYDMALLRPLIENVCYGNAQRYFALPHEGVAG